MNKGILWEYWSIFALLNISISSRSLRNYSNKKETCISLILIILIGTDEEQLAYFAMNFLTTNRTFTNKKITLQYFSKNHFQATYSKNNLATMQF